MEIINQSLAAITRHGYIVLFAWVTAEQLGIPLPAAPILIAAGVLSAAGHLSFANALMLGVAGCFIGDTGWYSVGKKWGAPVLGVLCKISLEPETCVRRSSELIARHGNRILLVAKFIPGISAVAVPVAANSGASLASFFFYDVLGSLLYVGAYLSLGHLVGGRIDKLSAVAHSLRTASAAFAVLGAAAIVGWRFWERRTFRQMVRMARITPAELRALLGGGENPFIVDLRHALDMLPDPRVIPGAIRLTPDELTTRHHEIPRDREIILYCT